MHKHPEDIRRARYHACTVSSGQDIPLDWDGVAHSLDGVVRGLFRVQRKFLEYRLDAEARSERVMSFLLEVFHDSQDLSDAVRPKSARARCIKNKRSTTTSTSDPSKTFTLPHTHTTVGFLSFFSFVPRLESQ